MVENVCILWYESWNWKTIQFFYFKHNIGIMCLLYQLLPTDVVLPMSLILISHINIIDMCVLV